MDETYQCVLAVVQPGVGLQMHQKHLQQTPCLVFSLHAGYDLARWQACGAVSSHSAGASLPSLPLQCRYEGGCDSNYSRADLQMARCFVCGHKGHLCCKISPGTAPQPSCWNCGGSHWAEDCKQSYQGHLMAERLADRRKLQHKKQQGARLQATAAAAAAGNSWGTAGYNDMQHDSRQQQQYGGGGYGDGRGFGGGGASGMMQRYDSGDMYRQQQQQMAYMQQQQQRQQMTYGGQQQGSWGGGQGYNQQQMGGYNGQQQQGRGYYQQQQQYGQGYGGRQGYR